MKRALLLIDIQKDFCKGGTLYVPNGDEVVPVANAMIQGFTDRNEMVIGTQDWHPANHGSFAINQSGCKVFDMIMLGGVKQILWPAHCVQDSPGAEFHDDLLPIPTIIQKGLDPEIDSYSGFFDNCKKNKTALDDELKANGITDLYIMGLATDYCVKFTALDAAELGYNTFVIVDGCQGVNANNNDIANAIIDMTKRGVMMTTAVCVANLKEIE